MAQEQSPAGGDDQAGADETEEQRFEEELEKRQPWLWVTPTLVVVTVLAWIAGLAVYQHEPSAWELMAIGGNFGLNTLDGQPWRLVTHMFLHAGFAHLFFNMFALVDLGRQCERLFGPGRYTALYFSSGIVGGLTSAMANPFTVSVGASGAIFGLLGGLLLLMLLREDEVPYAVLKARFASLIGFAGYSILGAMNNVPIDHAAHFGGFFAGGVCALFLAPAPRDQPGPRTLLLASGTALWLLIVGGIFSSAQLPAPERIETWRNEQRFREDAAWLATREQELNQRAEMASRMPLRPEGKAELFKVAAGWEEIRYRFGEHARHRTDLGELLEYAALKVRAYRALAQAPVGATELPAVYVSTMKEIRQMELQAAGAAWLRAR